MQMTYLNKLSQFLLAAAQYFYLIRYPKSLLLEREWIKFSKLHLFGTDPKKQEFDDFEPITLQALAFWLNKKKIVLHGGEDNLSS